MGESPPVPTSSDAAVSLCGEAQRPRRGRRAAPPAPSPVAQELRRRREALHLTVRAAAKRTGVSPGVISEIETGRRIPSLSTYAQLRRELGLDVAPSALVPWGPVPAELLEGHLRALAACVVAYGGAPLADVARALGISIPAVREGILRIADRLEAVGYRVVDDDVTVRLAPYPSAARALEIMGTAERLSELRSEHYELICIVAHLGTAVRSKIEEMFGRDCELLLRRLAERGYLERVTNDRDAAGAPTVYRVTAAAIAATGHPSLASLQRYLADSIVTGTDGPSVGDHASRPA